MDDGRHAAAARRPWHQDNIARDRKAEEATVIVIKGAKQD